jgi:hypothetical protein
VNRQALFGLLVMIGSEAATLARIEPFPTWNTPLCWTGFLLFADAVVWRARGDSWIRGTPREFAALALLSIPLWLVFEFYNRFIENWYYVGLPDHRGLRLLGYAWSFATIWPAIFLGAELVATWRGAPPPRDDRADPAPRRTLGPGLWSVVAAGAALLLWPLAFPSPYLAAPVWLGFILLLDPVNFAAGRESLIGDLKAGQSGRLLNLGLSGLLCGALWEAWNYWASAKWHYTVPIMEDLKVFEMPLPGYLGFPAFALECFTMYVFVRGTALRLLTGPGRRRVRTRRIGL